MTAKGCKVSGCEDSTGVEKKVRLRAKHCVLQKKRLWAGPKVGCVGRAGAGGCEARRALGSRDSAMAGVFRGRGWESNVRHIIGECNCRLLDALAGEFTGRGKESNVRHIIGEYNCRLQDALAGEFRGRGKERFQ